MIVETDYGFVILDVIFGIASIVYIFTDVDYVSYPQLHSGKRLPDTNIICHAPAIGAGKRALNVISGRHNIVRKALIKDAPCNRPIMLTGIYKSSPARQ